MKVETLVVFTTNRKGIIQDHVEAIRWSHTLPCAIVCVDDTLERDDPVIRREDNYFRIASRLPGQKHLSGFKNYEGIQFALNDGIDFRYVLCLDDDALPIGCGIDEWAIAKMDLTAIDLLGVRDRVHYQNYWKQVPQLLGRWLPEARNIFGPVDLSSETIFYAINWMSRGLVDAMVERSLLVPDGCAGWPLWPDPYISWVAQILGAYVVTWGSMDDPKPPIYANQHNHMRLAPSPKILRRDFLIYHPIRYVAVHDEQSLRQYYAWFRKQTRDGEPLW
jgi:hypothetical protein